MGLAATAVAAAVVWLATEELAWPARAFTTFSLSVLPALAVAQASVAEEEPAVLPRTPLYLTSAAVLWLLGALALGAALASGIPGRQLGVAPLPPGPLLAWSAAGTLAGLLIAVAGRALGIRESPIVAHLLPRSTGEKLAFVALSLSAGVGEELVFRGFLIPALTIATGSVALAVGLSATTFGLLHAYQRAGGVIRAALLGLILTVPFLVSGSVLPSIIAHAAYDIVVGLWLGEWLLRG